MHIYTHTHTYIHTYKPLPMYISCDPGHTTDYKLPEFFMLDEVLTVTI